MSPHPLRPYWPHLLVAASLLAVLWALQRGPRDSARQRPARQAAVTHVAGRIGEVTSGEDGDIIVRLHADNHRIVTIRIVPETGIAAQRLRTGASMEVVGKRLRQDGSTVYLPRSERDVTIQPDLESLERATATIADVARHRDGTRLTLQVVADRANEFRSRSGRHHLRFHVHDHTGAMAGIMWEGTFADTDIANLKSGRRLRLDAEVRRHRGRPSLVGLAAVLE